MPSILPNRRMITEQFPLWPLVTFSNFRQYTFIACDFRRFRRFSHEQVP
jgi:hypothetical protein